MIFEDKEYFPYYEKTFERHQKDLERVKNKTALHLRFNKKLGLAYIKIIEQLKHYKGELAGQTIKLEPWQKKMICIAFGWQKLSSKSKWVRRFNTIFIFIPRKNGKTLLVSAISIADSIILGEVGGEVVIFATKNKQAKLAWTGVEKMIEAHKELKDKSKSGYGVITLTQNDTSFSTLGRDSDTEDGLNVSLGIADEYHAHPDNSLYDVVESSQGARVQPLMLSITTAGFALSSPAYLMYIYAKNILEERIEDDNFFAFIAEPDKDDDPFIESTWIKANPNYGVSVSKDYMERKAKEAIERPETKNNFLVKNLNKWSNTAEEFIPYQDWLDCSNPDKFDTLPKDIKKVIGIDLSITDDFSSRADIYEYNNEYFIDIDFYIPKDTIFERERTLKVPLSSWVEQGYITATPGKTVDYDFIYDDMSKTIDKTLANVYDPYKAKHLIKKLEEDGFEDNIPLRQGFLSISSPTKFLLVLVKTKRLNHKNNPVLNWMISNLSIVRDQNDNIKPDKSDRNRKIDGVAAIINALSYFEAIQEVVKNVYEERGLRKL
ncbi:terminase large subunit [Aliarcobacter butzleri]|uniref:terminase large subunit n=1 Tax=Aliarcobacter butzleri TaxID=28197 RepID=UPI0021B377F6|nr:terminase TerL endonuclease subunit [Aliarcobacter butzleri]UXC28580.1 terminase large subunit [Aliarcobacter butzleri]UXC29217.1 terminase large subunit [Aliarcobacter butzleri]